METDKIGYDMGYGVVGNSATKFLLDHILTKEQAKDYREKLLKEDKKKYEEYLIYEKAIKEYNNKSW